MARKLSIDDYEALTSLLEQPGFGVLIDELAALKDAIEASVLKLRVDTASRDALLIAKCRAEGAADLLAAFKRRVETLRAKQDA